MKEIINDIKLPDYMADIIRNCKSVYSPESREDLLALAFGKNKESIFNVEYEVEGLGIIKEAYVTRCKNGAAVNYPEDYMRRRDPDCLLVSDDNETDKPRYKDAYKNNFDDLRELTFNWLKKQDLIFLPFKAGGDEYGYDAVLLAPANAAFFACGLADLQGFISISKVEKTFCPKAAIFLAPPFRHTHFGGKQIVVHNRLEKIHELFSYNLYPGPSAKKGIYGVLLNIGEKEGWITAHASAVKVVTSYDNEIVIMHEGASGGGKSEMIENIHKEMDGRALVGQNIITGEKNYINLNETCELRPITDDMALCHPKMQNDSKKLVIKDAEQGWFLRLDHIKGYGTTPQYEKIFTQPSEPLIFLNIDAVADSTCLVWDHIIDSNGKPCPNPRVILPRRLVSNVISDPVEVDVRSFGVRTPYCTKDNPSYGIIGLFHVLPPALAWLWRLVAPRGHNNPSITDSAGMSSEGVGSYWPFATGKMVEQANLLLDQIISSENTRYILIPNQHIGAYKVGFMPQWITREYIARRGSAKFKPEQLVRSRCSLLGYSLDSLKVDGQYIRKVLLQPHLQVEVGYEGYDEGSRILTDFFKKEILKFDTPSLKPLGHEIIKLLLNDATVDEYQSLITMKH